MLKYCLLTFVSLVLSACLKVSDNTKKSSFETQISGNSQSTSDQSSAVFVSQGSEANNYQVRLQLDSGSHLVRRYLAGQEGEALFLSPVYSEDGLFIDSYPVPGASYVYEMGFYENQQFIVNQSHQVRIPEDLEIRGETVLNENTRWVFNRVFLMKDAKILTQGFRLEIQANELSSDGSEILSFPAQGLAPGSGRSGSQFEIRLKKASGYLTVHLRGENGSQGLQGAHAGCSNRNETLHRPANGQQGQDGGSSGQAMIYISEKNDLKINWFIQSGLGGPGGEPGGPCYAGPTAEKGLAGREGVSQKSCIYDLEGERCF